MKCFNCKEIIAIEPINDKRNTRNKFILKHTSYTCPFRIEITAPTEKECKVRYLAYSEEEMQRKRF